MSRLLERSRQAELLTKEGIGKLLGLGFRGVHGVGRAAWGMKHKVIPLGLGGLAVGATGAELKQKAQEGATAAGPRVFE